LKAISTEEFPLPPLERHFVSTSRTGLKNPATTKCHHKHQFQAQWIREPPWKQTKDASHHNHTSTTTDHVRKVILKINVNRTPPPLSKLMPKFKIPRVAVIYLVVVIAIVTVEGKKLAI